MNDQQSTPSRSMNAQKCVSFKLKDTITKSGVGDYAEEESDEKADNVQRKRGHVASVEDSACQVQVLKANREQKNTCTDSRTGRSVHRNRCRGRSKVQMSQRDQQLKMKLSNEASPSKPSTSVSRPNTPHSDTDSDLEDDDILIQTDSEESDSQIGLVKLIRKTESKCVETESNSTSSNTNRPTAKPKQKTNKKLHSTTLSAKRTSLSRKKGCGRERRSKQLKMKTKRTLSKGRAASSRLRQAEQDDDSDWESAPEMEMSEIKQRLQGFDTNQLLGQESMTSDGRLLIDLDEDGEEIEEHQIPMKQQLEKTIADGCAKNNLSVNNVKKILRSLVTHDLVKEMLKTTLKSSTEDVPSGAIVYEPKLTRSKMKEVLEKGKDPGLWPVSPVKLGQPASSGPSILDVEFAEEEDDEDDEYNPSKDAEEAESDEESITSSQVSDFGSPFPGSPAVRAPSTPLTPTLSGPVTPTCSSTPTATSLSKSHVVTSFPHKKDGQTEDSWRQMGPPIAPAPSLHSTRQRLVFASPERKVDEREEDGIARRTRSKLPLTTTSLYEIEDAFVAPDITPDMYDTTCDDTDWQDFLHYLHNPGGSGTQNESMEVGEEDDPEFNYIAEAETEEVEAEEIRFDGPFRISRKELNSLMEELEDLFNEEDYSMIGLRTNLASAHENVAHFSKKSISASDPDQEPLSPQLSRRLRSHGKEPRSEEESEKQSAPPVKPMVLENQKRQIEQQLRQHIQLTTQMYVLAQGHAAFQEMASDCKKILKELDHFRSVSVAGSKSVYNVCNLSGAADIVSRDIDWESHRVAALTKGAASVSQVLSTSSSSSLSQTTTHHNHSGPTHSARGCHLNKNGLHKQCLPLLDIQKEVIWNSPVFLYPCFLPRKGLIPKSATKGYNLKAYYTASEDKLLVLGKDQFKHVKGKVYPMIQTYMLPTKTIGQLRSRFSQGSKSKIPMFETFLKTGEVPETPQDIEEFSEKAPCEQALSVLPTWCKGWKIQLDAPKLKQEKEDKLKKIADERAKKAAEKRRDREKRNGKLVFREKGYKKTRKRKIYEVKGSSSEKESEEEESDSDSDNSSVSSHRPPSKRQRRCKTKSSLSQRVSIISSVVSPSSPDKPSALVTSQGIYVPLSFADPAKVNAALASVGYTAVNELGERQMITTEQLFGSKYGVGSGSPAPSARSSGHTVLGGAASCKNKRGGSLPRAAVDEPSDKVEHSNVGGLSDKVECSAVDGLTDKVDHSSIAGLCGKVEHSSVNDKVKCSAVGGLSNKECSTMDGLSNEVEHSAVDGLCDSSVEHSSLRPHTISDADVPAQPNCELSVENDDRQVNLISDGTDCEQTSSEQNCEDMKCDRSSCVLVNSEQINCDTNNTDQMNTEQVVTEQMSCDQINTEQMSCDQINAEQVSCDEINAEQTGSEKMSSGQTSAEEMDCEQDNSKQLKSEFGRVQTDNEQANSNPMKRKPVNSAVQDRGYVVVDTSLHTTLSPRALQSSPGSNKHTVLSEDSSVHPPQSFHNSSLSSSIISQTAPLSPAVVETSALQGNMLNNKTCHSAANISECSDNPQQGISVAADVDQISAEREGYLNNEKHAPYAVSVDGETSLAYRECTGDSYSKGKCDQNTGTVLEAKFNSMFADHEIEKGKISDSQGLLESMQTHGTDEEVNQGRGASPKSQLQDKSQRDSRNEIVSPGLSVSHCKEVVPYLSFGPSSNLISHLGKCKELQRAITHEGYPSQKSYMVSSRDKHKDKELPGVQTQQCTSTESSSKESLMDGEGKVELEELYSVGSDAPFDKHLTIAGSAVTEKLFSQNITSQDVENQTLSKSLASCQRHSPTKNSLPSSLSTSHSRTTKPAEENPHPTSQRCQSVESSQINSLQLSPSYCLSESSSSQVPTSKPDRLQSEHLTEPVHRSHWNLCTVGEQKKKSVESVLVSTNLATYSDQDQHDSIHQEKSLRNDTVLGLESTESIPVIPHKLNPSGTDALQKPVSSQASSPDQSHPDNLQKEMFSRCTSSSGGTVTTQTVTSQKQKSVESKVRAESAQELKSSGGTSDPQLVYEFHIKANSGALVQKSSSLLTAPGKGSNLQKTLPPLPTSPPPPSQDRTADLHLDVLRAAMKMMLGNPGKEAAHVPNGLESVSNATKSRIPKVSLSSLPSIVNTAPGVNITVNMLYTSDYVKASTSSDDQSAASEGPSSTTPDGDEDGHDNGGQGETTSQQGETSHQGGDVRGQGAPLLHRSPLSDDAVSTTSDIGGENLESGAECVENSSVAAISQNLNTRDEDGSTNFTSCSLVGGEHSESLNLVSVTRSASAENSGQGHAASSPQLESRGSSSSLRQLPVLTLASGARDLESASSEVTPGSPQSESVGSSSLRQLPVSLAPTSMAGEFSALGSSSSDPSQSHESLCTVSSSSPFKLQRRHGLRCEDLHSEETIQFHIGGFESFFEVSSSGIDVQVRGSSQPLVDSGGREICSESQQGPQQSLTGSAEVAPSGGANSVTGSELCDSEAAGFHQKESAASHSAPSQLAGVRLTPFHNLETSQIPSQPSQVTVSQMQSALVQPAASSSFAASDSVSSQPPPVAGESPHLHRALPSYPAAVTPILSADGSVTTTAGASSGGVSGASVVTATPAPHIPAVCRPHSSWSGLSSVCNSANFGFIVSVVVPNEDGEEDNDVSMDTGEVSVVHEDEEGDNDGPVSSSGHPSTSTDGCVGASVDQDPDNSTSRSQSSRISPHLGSGSPGPPMTDASQTEAEPSSPDQHVQMETVENIAVNFSREITQTSYSCHSANVTESSVARNESLVAAVGSPRQKSDAAGRQDVDAANRQELLQLINSAGLAKNPVQEDAPLSNLGPSSSAAGLLGHEEVERVEEDTRGRGSVVESPPGSPPCKMSRFQAENETSPVKVTQQVEERPLSLFDNPALLSVQSTQSPTPTTTSTELAAQDSISQSIPGRSTPGVLSSLGLVSVATTTQHDVSARTEGDFLDDEGVSSQANTKVIATLTPLLCSSPTETPTTYTLQCTEPENPASPTEPPSPSQSSSSSFLPVLAPKPGPLVYTSPPRLPQRQRSSPKKHQLQKQVRSLLPKGYTYEMRMMSPTKAAARTLKRKATLFCQRSPSKTLMPKDSSSAVQQSAQNGQAVQAPSSTLPRWNQRGMNLRNRGLKKKEAEAAVKVAAEKKSQHAPQHPKGNEEGSQEESDETGSELEDVAMLSQEDSQNEEEAGEAEDDGVFLNNLMAASSTIGFNPFKKSDKYRSQQEIRKEEKLALLAPDILETDSRKDERDTWCAQAYLNKLKVMMQKDPSTYTSFMDLVRQFDMNQLSPVQVYDSLTALLSNYPELLEDFAAFLLPAQALHTGCTVSNQLSSDVRTFLRKLELHYDKAEAKYQQILRTLGKWDFKTKSPEQFRQTVMPLLRSMPRHMHADFLRFFPDLVPPESHMEREDFEDIHLGDKADGDQSPDNFEDMQYPDENDPYRTKRCPCSCHQEAPMATSNRKHAKGNRDRITHCYSCCLKVVGGQLYFQPSNVTTRRPVSATFHASVPMPVPPDLPPPDLLRSRRSVCHREQSAADKKDDAYYGDNSTNDNDIIDDDLIENPEEGCEEKKHAVEENSPDEKEEEDEDEKEEEDKGEVAMVRETSTPVLPPQHAASATQQQSMPAITLASVSSTSMLSSGSQEVTQLPRTSVPSQPPSLGELLAPAMSSSPKTGPSLNTLHCKTGHSFTPMHSTAGHTASALHPMSVGGSSCPVQPVTVASFSALPSPQRRVTPAQVLPAARPADFQHSRHIIPTPLGNNSRMRKRILSMRPGCQVSSFMHSVAGRSRPQPQPQRDPLDLSQTPALTPHGSAPVPVVPISPGGGAGGASPGAAASQLLSGPRILQSDREWGTLSVKGPDNTVIMFNSSVPSPALADTLPGLHEQSPFFSPLPPPATGAGESKGTAREARASGGGSEGGGVLLVRSAEEQPREEECSPPPSSHLPTITSPGKNIQQGSFAGLLHKSRPSGEPDVVTPLQFSTSSKQQKGDSLEAGEEEGKTSTASSNSAGAGSSSCLAPAPPLPLMSDDTINALFEQMREGGTENSCSISLTQQAGQSALCAPSPPSSPPPEHSRADEQPVAVDALSAGCSHSVDWTREQDKLILETVRDHGDTHNTYVEIATKLQNVTPQQVADRLSTLMELLNSSEEETDDENFMEVE